MRKRNVDMLEGDLGRNILLFALPVTASGVIQLLFNAIDMIVVGQFSGSSSMAAVSSTGSLISLITNLFIGLSVGSSVCIARRIGSGDYDSISDAVQTSITLALIFGFILMGLGIVFSRALLEMMKSPVDVIDLSVLYLRIYFTGMPATMVYNFASAVLRAKGDTKRPLLALTISGILNAVLNLFFVVPLKMDVAGVGLASSISAYVSAIIVLIVLITDPGFTRLDPRHLYIDGSSFREIARVGIPAGIQSTVFSVSNVVIQSSINGFGSAAMAGNGAGSSVSNFIYAGMNSFYQTCLTFSSQNMGAGKIERVKKTLILCLLYVAVTGIVLGWGSVFFGRQLLSLYTHDPEVMDYGMIRLRYICLPYFLYGMMDVMVGSLRGMGSSVAPMVVSLLGVCAFRLLWVYTYFQSHPTFEDLFLSYPVSWIITAGTLFVMNLIVYGRLKRKKLSEE
ncbi:MAG: MATE family efflux transporter [Erysipelotrichaceae bacterium]|nr:MATE family efflux transporter [Erysipelotrichaceae bacterium]